MKSPSATVLSVLVGFILMQITGCTEPVRTTGFLSDYSRLTPEKGGLRYIDMKGLAACSGFIVEPVVVYLQGIPQGKRPDRAVREELAGYLHNAVVSALSGRYMIVSQPAPGVARIRIAITDIDRSSPAMNVLPHTKLAGLGLGGVSMEGELLDSQTGEQIGALIEGKKGSRISSSGLEQWGDAHAVMDEWAGRLRKRVDEAHGY